MKSTPLRKSSAKIFYSNLASEIFSSLLQHILIFIFSTEPPLFNFRIGVSDRGSTSGFDPSMFNTCVQYNGNVMSGETLHLSCDYIHIGRYVMLYVPGDGFTGGYVMALSTSHS